MYTARTLGWSLNGCIETNSSELSRDPGVIETIVSWLSFSIDAFMVRRKTCVCELKIQGAAWVFVKRCLPGLHARSGTYNNFHILQCLELCYIQHTKHIRQGSAIACRNFLLSVCFHKQSFPKEAHSARKICYKPFAKGCASNYWGKCAVCLFLFSCSFVCMFHTGAHLCGNKHFNLKHCCITGRNNSKERS